MTHGKRNWAEVEAVELPAPLPAILDDLDDTAHYALRRHIVELMWEIESLNEKDLLQHTILAGLHDRVDSMEAKLKAANEKISALMDTRRSYTPPPMRAVSMTECIVSIEALELLAQEGGDNE